MENEPHSCSKANSSAEHIAFAKVIVGFLLLWQSIFKVANIAVETLLKFFCVIFKHTPFAKLNDHFPNFLLKAYRLLDMKRDDFQKLVVCRRCNSTYNFEECIDYHNRASFCSFVRFPNHPLPNKRKPCSSPLLKHVKTLKGKNKFITLLLSEYH